jgi:quinoprotein glucose dehydrogenase
VNILNTAIESKNRNERQAAFRDLALIKSDAAAAILLAGVERLKNNRLPADTRVDVRVAARHSQSEAVKKAIADYEASLDTNDITAPFLDSLEGGSAERGKKIFYERTQVSCVRCHKFNGRGGDVGPVLDKLGREKDRKYLLEAIVKPNADIAKNFESLTIVDLDGIITTGVVKANNEESVELLTAEGKRVKIAKGDIDFQKQSKSPMPEDLVKHLSLDDVRDLVEFLKLGVE